jgi:ribose-phosphate pyrophosphokinase
VLFTLNGAEDLARGLARELDARAGAFERRSFPDGETYIRVDATVDGCDTLILCGLEDPDTRFLSLWFLARALRDAGARSVGLVAPYLAYMRQDKRFQPGEALTSAYFADLLSARFDWLATVDPHLHRYHSLDEVYGIPARAVHAAPLLVDHLARREGIVLVGPDAESEQWVGGLGERAGVPWMTARKVRRGDRDVTIELPDLNAFAGRQAVLVDDVISSGTTLERAIAALANAGLGTAACLCIHGLFAGDAEQRLRAAGAGELISTNTIAHDSNRIDVTPLLAGAVRELLGHVGGTGVDPDTMRG